MIIQDSSITWAPMRLQPMTTLRQILGVGIRPSRLAGCWYPIGPKERQGSQIAGMLLFNRLHFTNWKRDKLTGDKPSVMKLKHTNSTLSGRSTEDQLLRLFQSISDSIQDSPMKRTLIYYLRAYDRDWQDALLLRVLQKGESPNVISWIQTWLANHQTLETVEGVRSKNTILKQDVPQGSVFSPLLLLFFIDDLWWGSVDLHVSLLSDDMAILAQDSKLNVAGTWLQKTLEAVQLSAIAMEKSVKTTATQWVCDGGEHWTHNVGVSTAQPPEPFLTDQLLRHWSCGRQNLMCYGFHTWSNSPNLSVQLFAQHHQLPWSVVNWPHWQRTRLLVAVAC